MACNSTTLPYFMHQQAVGVLFYPHVGRSMMAPSGFLLVLHASARPICETLVFAGLVFVVDLC